MILCSDSLPEARGLLDTDSLPMTIDCYTPTEEGVMEMLCDIIQRSTTVEVVYACLLDDEKIARLTNLMPNVQSLHLRDNRVGPTALAALLSRISLTVLDLSGSKIGPAGARVLATALHNSLPLECLVLTACQLGDQGAIAIAESVPSCCLSSLHLRRNGIASRGAVAIANAMQHPNFHLQFLFLDSNLFDNPISVAAFANAIKSNPKSLIGLSLQPLSSFAEESLLNLVDALSHNTALCHTFRIDGDSFECANLVARNAALHEFCCPNNVTQQTLTVAFGLREHCLPSYIVLDIVQHVLALQMADIDKIKTNKVTLPYARHYSRLDPIQRTERIEIIQQVQDLQRRAALYEANQ